MYYSMYVFGRPICDPDGLCGARQADAAVDRLPANGDFPRRRKRRSVAPKPKRASDSGSGVERAVLLRTEKAGSRPAPSDRP